MPLTGTPSTDRSESNVVHCLRKRITFNNPGTTAALTVGSIPPGATVVGGGILVITLFDGTGTDLISVGNSVAGVATAAVFASSVDVSTVGLKALDDLAALSATNYSDTADMIITATYTDQNANAAAGVADIIIAYVTRPAT